MVEGQRPFNPEVLTAHAIPDIRPPLGVGALVWRYTVLVQIREVRPGEEAQSLATLGDLISLRNTFCTHFGGTTIFSAVRGLGLRNPQDPASLELNEHVPFVVYARPIVASDRYFDRLQQELQEALVQGLIAIEREQVLLIGTSQPATAPGQLKGQVIRLPAPPQE